MAGSIDHKAMSTSPNSSEEFDSHHATPATKLSAFSPDEIHDGLSTGSRGIVRSKIPPTFHLTQIQAGASPKSKQTGTVQDPFFSDPVFTSTTRGQPDACKLSPSASAFTPNFTSTSGVGSFSSGRASGSVNPPVSAADSGTCNAGYGSLTTSSGSKTSRNEEAGKKFGPNASPEKAISSPSPASGISPSNTGNVSPVVVGSFSSDDGTSRCLLVHNIHTGTSLNILEDFFSKLSGSMTDVASVDLATTGYVYVRFGDIRDADKVFSSIQAYHPEWRVEYIPLRYFLKKFDPDTLKYSSVSGYEGQLMVTAKHHGPFPRIETQLGPALKDLLANYGDLMAFETNLKKLSVATFRVEYFNIKCAKDALASLNGFKLGAYTLNIVRYEPDLQETEQLSLKAAGPIIIGQEETALEKAFKGMSTGDRQRAFVSGNIESSSGLSYQSSTPGNQSFTNRKDFGGHHTPAPLAMGTPSFGTRSAFQSPMWSPTTATYSEYGVQTPLWPPFSPGAIGQERANPLLPTPRSLAYNQPQRCQPKPNGRQFNDHASGHHNIVDVDRIRQGHDVRTTIMLRNIPNKIDQAMLKDIVDETSLGKYDFMYLRIDFANNCNVGYAFINFEDPYYIIEFVRARAGHRWNRFNSDKVAEVSYATIQGRDCLVQKFRNSSVMLENPSFRPKIFHVGTGPLVGTEDVFPGPDNPSKMRRSVENAEHVGLFAPRAGQNFRDEQRRRRSQYDRGTRLAEIEDSLEASQRQYSNVSQAFRAPRPFGMFNGAYAQTYGSPIF